MAKRLPPSQRNWRHIPRPTKLVVLSATPRGVRLQWNHSDRDVSLFLIHWAGATKPWTLLNEVTPAKGRRRRAAAGSIFVFRDALPTSGTSRYRVQAVRMDEFNDVHSKFSNIVTVSIKSPAAGDV